MRSAFFGFHVASTGLHTARAMINVTSHNIANSEIPGFSRQVATARANTPLNLLDGRGMYGTGSQVTGINQIRDRFLDSKFWGQRAVHGRHTVTNSHLNFVETVFNQLPDAGVLRIFGDFFGRMSYLTTRAQDATFRTNVISGADALANEIRHNAAALQRQQMDVNREVADVVHIMNSLGSQIATLNEQISIFERDGSRANDLRDQRNLLIDNLSQFVNVQVEERDHSNPPMNPHDMRLTVMINGYDFVNHSVFNRLELVARNNPHDPTSGSSRNEMDVPGLYDIRFAGTGSPFNIYSPSLSGQLRGLIDIRDGNGGFATVDTPVMGGTFDLSNPNTWPPNFEPGLSGTWPPGFDIRNPHTWTNVLFPSGGVFDPTNAATWPTGASIHWPHPGLDITNPTTWPSSGVQLDASGNPVTRPATTNRFKGIPFYMNQLNELVRTFARAMNEGRNANGEKMDGVTGHIFGYDANGDNLNTMFFTFTHPNTGVAASVECDIMAAHGLRRWIFEPIPPATGPNVVQDHFLPGVPGEGGMPAPPAGFRVARDATGNPMFTLDYSQMNAFNFKINPALTEAGGQNLLAASSNPNTGEANNDVVFGFLAVGNDRTLFSEGRLLDFIIATSNHLAVDNQQANRFRLSYEEITMQTHNHRLSIKGVDTNEEMMNLVRFQTLFTASSRLVNVLDSIYDTLINRLGNF
ncbi:MAG: flagellar hook-associated protein FlgK [Defluviitaleaceae bacterium]|nr:flagellar hook-associated protein FlgK [Defluviitaleaceae bacterium]